jgi:hypothetical protein
METDYLPIISWGLCVAGIIIYAIVRRRRRKALPYSFRPRSCGPAAVGAIYELLNKDQRHTVEIIVEQRAEERRPEYPDGNLPEPKAPDRLKP